MRLHHHLNTETLLPLNLDRSGLLRAAKRGLWSATSKRPAVFRHTQTIGLSVHSYAIG
jgi:hypothetical protein